MEPKHIYEKQPHIFNVNNPAVFTVEELKKFAERFAEKCQSQIEGDLTGFWDTCKELFHDKFKQGTREIVLKWWCSLEHYSTKTTNNSREFYCNKYYPYYFFNELSYTEIENIWKNETSTLSEIS